MLVSDVCLSALDFTFFDSFACWFSRWDIWWRLPSKQRTWRQILDISNRFNYIFLLGFVWPIYYMYILAEFFGNNGILSLNGGFDLKSWFPGLCIDLFYSKRIYIHMWHGAIWIRFVCNAFSDPPRCPSGLHQKCGVRQHVRKSPWLASVHVHDLDSSQ